MKMRNIIVNGEGLSIKDNTSIVQLLEENFDFELSNIAVACNLVVVPREKWKSTFCQKADVIEIIEAVQGG